MLLDELLVADARDNELVLSWLAPVDVVIRVEKRAVADHDRHLEALVHNLEIAVVVDRRDFNFTVVLRQHFHVILKVVNELVGQHILHLHLNDAKCLAIAVP